MNVSKFEKRLNKLNTFFDAIKSDRVISNIESNLLKQYVSELYESLVLTEDNQSNGENIQRNHTHSVDKPIEKREMEITQTPPPTISNIEKVVEVQPAAKPVIVENQPKIEEKPTPEPVREIKEYHELFDLKTGTDVSEKLGQSAIKQLSKAFSINERIFTINELFSGDATSFNETITKLDGFNNFDEAKTYLSTTVIPKYTWDDKDKMKKAQNFILMVKRRFS
ncbi:MAG TPA: hypothetical protein PK246_04565 [Saprospiraceae bacterium]|nr:hypothetical protein [Saprospiraceae bacterium]